MTLEMRVCQCKVFRQTVKKSSRFLYELIFTKKHKHFKKVSSLIFGILLSIGFYYLILIDLNFTKAINLLISLLFCTILGVSITCSRQIRCISCLTLPIFCSKVGRGVLKTFIVALVITGPINNLTNNGKDVVRVFACTTSLTFNLTMTRFELMFKPFTQAIFGLKSDTNEIKDTLRSIRDISAPIVGEVEDETEMRKMKEENDYIDKELGDSLRSKELDTRYDTKGERLESERYEKLYMKKISMRCEDQFTRAAKRCRGIFEKAYNTCYDKVTWVAAWLLCWPMKLDFVCNIAQALSGKNRCDPSKDIDPGFGEGFQYLKRSRREFAENFKNVHLEYQLPKIVPPIDFRDTRDTAKLVLHQVNEKKHLLDEIFLIIKRCLTFAFLKIIIKAQTYHENYLKSIDFDNIYITRYFRRIDARRKTNRKHFILPLKKIERPKYRDPCNLTPLKHERQDVIKQTVYLLLEIVTVTIFILLDWIFYELLDLVRRHGRIDYVQMGHHDLMLQIKGTGLIANLLRSLVKGFNIKKRINIIRTNEKCLPLPKKLANYYLYKIYGFYFLIWLLLLLQIYTQRLQRRICAYFYPKIEKKRILHLYNSILKRRIGYYRFMKNKIQKQIEQHRLQENYNIFIILRLRYPKLNFLRLIPSARRKCLLCHEIEPFNRKKTKFFECSNTNCYMIYCEECWIENNETCLACQLKDTITSDNNEASSSDSDNTITDDDD